MNDYNHSYHCEACGHEWTEVWSGTNIADECPECGNKPVEPIGWEKC